VTGEKVVFAYIEEPPFAATVNGQPSGSDIDVARAILSRMGIRDVEVRKVEFPDLLPGVATNKWTMNTALFVTPDRAKVVTFSNPIWALVDGMIVRAGNPKRITSYKSIAASDARLGVVKETVQVAAAEAAGIPADRIVGFDSQDAVVAAMKSGQVDAYSNTALGQRGFLAAMKDPALTLAEPFEPPMENGRACAGFGAFSFNKNNVAFIERFNGELAKYLGTAEHRTLLGKYGFSAEEITPALTAKSADLVK
jgi:polar amino acid transport system substrate-binding protein